MSDIRFEGWLHRSGTGGVYQDSAGNVGIASTQPQTRLDIGNGEFQVGPTGIATVTTINTTNIINATPLTNRNIIINGDCRIAQRATSSTSGGNTTIDRWRGGVGSGVGSITITRSQQSLSSSDTPYTLGFRKYFRIALSGAGTANAAGALENQIRIEAQDIANSGWNYTSATSYMTISFWFRCSTNQTFYGRIYSYDGTAQAYAYGFTASANDTWTKITHTFPGNSNLTFDDNVNAGMQLLFIPFYGTDYTNDKTLNAWAAHSSSNYIPDMASTWLTAGASTFDMTGLQLEVGSVATPFEHRSFADELRRSQRYYFRIPYQGVASSGGVYLGSGKETGSTARVQVDFPQPMRTVPSCAAANLLADDETSATSANTVSSVLASTVEPDRGRVQFTGGSYSSGNSISLATGQATDSYLEGDADL